VFLLAPAFRSLWIRPERSSRGAGAYQIDALEQRRDAERIEAVEVEAAQGVAVPDLDFLLEGSAPYRDPGRARRY
jgi:hypothetical protein